jgi:hypothetical protein
MNDFIKVIGSATTGIILTAAVFLFGGNGAPLVVDQPSAEAPKALAGDVRCPSPPRTGGAIFVAFSKGPVISEGGGGGKAVEALNCDYMGQWSYTVDADGRETLQKYAGPDSPIIFDQEAQINRVLADLN